MRTKKSIIIKICIGLAFIAVGLTIMFDVLRPQDNYKKTDATIICVVDGGRNEYIIDVEYYIKDKKYVNTFNAWKECSVGEKIAIRYNAENPNKLRPRFYLFFISLTVEAMVIGISTLLSLVAVKYKLRYKSEKEQKRDKTVYYIYVFTTLALLVLIPIVGAFSPLYYF